MNDALYSGKLASTLAVHRQFTCECSNLLSVATYQVLNARTDPKLIQQLIESGGVNWSECNDCGEKNYYPSPLVYHDPQAKHFVLVLPPMSRHLELAQRALVYQQLAADTGSNVPKYVADFPVVFGGGGLSKLLGFSVKPPKNSPKAALTGKKQSRGPIRSTRTRQAAAKEAPRTQSSTNRRNNRRSQPVPQGQTRVVSQKTTLHDQSDFQEGSGERRQALSRERRVGSSRRQDNRRQNERVSSPRTTKLAQKLARNTQRRHSVTQSSVRTKTRQSPRANGIGAGAAGLIAKWKQTEQTSRIVIHKGQARVWVTATGGQLQTIQTKNLEVRLQLHRGNHEAFVVLLLGTRAVLDGDIADTTPIPVFFHLGDSTAIRILKKWREGFAFGLDVFDGQYRSVSSREITADIEDNIAYALEQGTQHRVSIPVGSRSFEKEVAAYRDSQDPYGWDSPWNDEFDPQALDTLVTASEVRCALSMINRFSRPKRQVWLLETRGYSIRQWKAQRTAIISSAIQKGLWPGQRMVSIAESEGMFSSQRELMKTLMENFRRFRKTPECDLPRSVIDDNWNELQEMAQEVGAFAKKSKQRALSAPSSSSSGQVSPPPKPSGPPRYRTRGAGGSAATAKQKTVKLSTLSQDVSQKIAALSRARQTTPPAPSHGGGELSQTTNNPQTTSQDVAGFAQGSAVDLSLIPMPEGIPVPESKAHARIADQSTESLVELLHDSSKRLAAARELARRKANHSIGGVFRAIESMERDEAVIALGSATKFGEAAVPRLVASLRHEKVHIRQGAALALGLLKSDAGVEELADLLIAEPTTLWKDVARAVAEKGNRSITTLMSRLSGGTPDARERIAWAFAHIAAGGDDAALRALAKGHDTRAKAVASRALALVAQAKTSGQGMSDLSSMAHDDSSLVIEDDAVISDEDILDVSHLVDDEYNA